MGPELTDTTSGRRSLREKQRDLTRGLLLRAAREVFAANGYSASTVDDIANAAGTSRKTFYLHFKAKSDVVAQLMEEIAENRQRVLWARLGALDGPSPEDLREWIREYLEEYSRDASLIRAAQEAFAFESDMASEPAKLLARVLDELRQAGGVWSDLASPNSAQRAEAEALAVTLFSQITRTCEWLYIYGWDGDPQLAATAIAHQWFPLLSKARRNRTNHVESSEVQVPQEASFIPGVT